MNRYNTIINQAILTLVLAVVTTLGSAQSQRTIDNELLCEKVQHLSDSIENLNSAKNPIYLGYEVTVAFPQYRIQSNILKLDGLQASFSGGALGGVFANQKGKVKANIGMYYSDSNVPYSINLFKTSVSSSIYLLRLKEPNYHTLEPYSVIGVNYQMNRFFGHYLDNTSPKNLSVTDEPLLGKVNTTQLTFGGGIEYQLENDFHRYIHFFTEFTYAKNINTNSSNSIFSGTKISDSLLITGGISFGIVK